MTKMSINEIYDYLLIYAKPGEDKLFFVLDPEDIVCTLINAAYKLEESIEFTDLEERLREEIGFNGRCFIREYCNSLEDWDKLESVPYPLQSDMTIPKLTKLINDYNKNQKDGGPLLAVIPK